MDEFAPFDLKITKLTGGIWDRTNPKHLLKQLLDEQGNPRHSIENRIIIAFDKSANSSMTFLRKNEAAIIKALLKVAFNPYLYTYWLNEYECWGSIILIKEGEYHPSTEYYEHPIGLGMREPGKAEFERHIILEVAEKSGYRIRPNRNPKEIGVDGELKIDVTKLQPIQKLKLEKQLAFGNMLRKNGQSL